MGFWQSRGMLAAQAFLIFVLLDVGLRLFGFPRAFRLVQWWGQGDFTVLSEPTAPREFVNKVLQAVAVATRYYCRRGLDCLPRSTAIYVLLRARGVPATLHIGVKRFPFGAHAWVECLGDVLDDSSNGRRHEGYKPIIVA